MGVVSILPAGLGPANTIRDESRQRYGGHSSHEVTEGGRNGTGHLHLRWTSH